MLKFNSPSLQLKIKKMNTVDASHNSSTLASTFKLDEDIKEMSLQDNIQLNDTETEIINISSINSEEFLDEEEKEGLNIIYKNKENNKEIQYISIDLLLKKIAFNEIEDDYNFQINLIRQCKCFIGLEILVFKIINLYDYYTKKHSFNIEIKYPIGIVKFANNWIIHKYKEDFIKHEEMKEKLNTFYEKLLKRGEMTKYFANREVECVYEILNQDNKDEVEYSINQIKGRKKSQALISFKSLKFTNHKKSEIFDILLWDESEIARELTLISQQLMSKVEYNELLMACWTKKEKYTRAPNVMKVIDRFNKFSLWMMEEILSYDKKKMRAACIEKLVKIAIECRNINNYNDCVNIVSALNCFIVKNLKKTWKVMNPQVLPLLESLNLLCSYDNNYKNLRVEMNDCLNKPCIPYLGLFLKELAFIEEGPKYVKQDYLINYDKIKKVSASVNFFFKFQIQAYLLRPVDQLSILNDLHPKSEEDIEVLANKMEPIWLLKTKNKTKRITTTDSRNYQLKPLQSGFSNSGERALKIEDHF